MTEYNGSIDLISGLRPKNGGDFPLVNAPDVLLADGRRLSEVDFENLGGGDTFPVSFTVDASTMTATCDKTFEEIYAAVGEGKFIYGAIVYTVLENEVPVRIPFACIGADTQPFALFEGTYELMGMKAALIVFADNTVQARMTEISSGGGDSTPPTQVDLSRLDSGGIIEETFADGTVKTTTIEYDSSGNPVKITDGDGNVTDLVW